MIETYGQRYGVEWEAFHNNSPTGTGEVYVRPTKPRVNSGILMPIRSQAMLAADRHLRRVSPAYARANARVLRITPMED